MDKIVIGKFKFEIIESVPYGYKIWNIPTYLLNDYLPLFKDHPTIEDRIDIDSLKAIKAEGVKEMVEASRCGIRTKNSIINRIAALEKKDLTPAIKQELKILKDALYYAKKIKWDGESGI